MTDFDLRSLFSSFEKGDREAFSVIYQELKQPVFTICYRILQSREEAEDITQDVFLRLFHSPPDASVNNVRAWIFQMARNLSIDALRRMGLAAREAVPVGEYDAYGQIHLQMDVERALRKLPLRERQILTLHLNAGLPFREIATMMELSLPGAYRIYRKALKTVQIELNGG